MPLPLRLPSRTPAALLAALALSTASPARAGVSGSVEVQGSGTQNLSDGAGPLSSTLAERLWMHYAGMPFGPSVAIATAGGAFSNVSSWQGSRLLATSRTLSLDGSLGFLPRRAVPLRLYAAGTIDAGTSGPLAIRGLGPSLLYGATLSLEPGKVLPGLRLDASEGRSSRPGHERMTDLQRRFSASTYGTIAGQRVDVGVRAEKQHLDTAGDVTSKTATILSSSAFHQTAVVAQEVRRSLPILGGITRDRLLSANTDQLWDPAFRTQLGARLSDAAAPGGEGRQGDGHASVAWTPVRGARQLTLSAGGNAGFAETASPGASSSGRSWGANGRAALGQAVGPVTCTVAAGASTNDCACGFGNRGRTTLVDATLSVALLPAGRAAAQADYVIANATAPLGRGGDRLEQHARAYGRLGLGEVSSVTASLSWDDAVRELLDITTARAATLHERAVHGTAGIATRLGTVALTAEASQTLGSVAGGSALFIAGGARQVRSMTSAQLGASWAPIRDLGLQGQLVATEAELTRAPTLHSEGANVSLWWRLGRVFASAQWQLTSVQLGDEPAARQQSFQVVLSRPFEL